MLSAVFRRGYVMRMAKTFRQAFLDALDQSGWTVAYVAKVAGVSAQQLHKVKQGKSLSTNVDDALRVAHVFGATLDEFLGDEAALERREAAALWHDLTQAERDLLKAAARGRAAQARGED